MLFAYVDILTTVPLDIFIKSITKKIPFDEIRYYFVRLDPYFLDEQIILNLLKYLPSQEEAKKITAYNDAPLEQVEKLGIPEKFCLQVRRVWESAGWKDGSSSQVLDIM